MRVFVITYSTPFNFMTERSSIEEGQHRMIDHLTNINTSNNGEPDVYIHPVVGSWVKKLLSMLNLYYSGEKIGIAGTFDGGVYLVLKPLFTLYIMRSVRLICVYSFHELEATQFPFSDESLDVVLAHIRTLKPNPVFANSRSLK